MRRATRRGGDLCYLDNIISIHALLAESDQGQQGFVERCAISIHALLAESDSSNFLPPLGPPYFYPRSPCGERRCEPWPPHRTTQFLSTLSLRRATSAQAAFPPGECISIHALLAESDAAMAAMAFTAAYFYPRSPCGERPSSVLMALPSYIFLSTLSLRRATVDFSSNARATLISIHALLAESDMPISTSFPIALNFYPRSPCGERRWRCSCRRLYSNFYPRSPCGERRHSCRADAGDQPISIHALLAESDGGSDKYKGQALEFLSTLSLRRATQQQQQRAGVHGISIHALLAESDGQGLKASTVIDHFYPRSPCGERPAITAFFAFAIKFLSTLSLRRATSACP